MWCLPLVWLTCIARLALAEPPAATNLPASPYASVHTNDASPVPRAAAADSEPLPDTPQLLAALPHDLLQVYPAAYLVYREPHALRPHGNEATLVHQLLWLNNRLDVEELAEQQIVFLPTSQS